MAVKKYSPLAPDGGTYVVMTDGQGTLSTKPPSTASKGTSKPSGRVAPDGSLYVVLTDGSGNLI